MTEVDCVRLSVVGKKDYSSGGGERHCLDVNWRKEVLEDGGHEFKLLVFSSEARQDQLSCRGVSISYAKV